MHLSVFLPDAALADPSSLAQGGLKTLWLLHGHGGDCTEWTRLSMLEHHAEQAGIAVVMPNLDNAMYMDMAHGGYSYFTYLTEDMPRHVRNLVRVLSARPQDNFVAGAGIGGYGAVKWLLRAPDAFAGAAAFSGPFDIVAALRRMEQAGTLADDWAAAFGDAGRIRDTPDDIVFLAREALAAKRRPPPVRLALGAGDDGFGDDLEATQALRQAGLDIDIREEAEARGWPFWDGELRAFIAAIAAPANGGAA